MRATDLWFYGRFGLDVSSYSAVFPLVEGPLFAWLDGAYYLLLVELIALTLAIAWDGGDRDRTLVRLAASIATCYAAGVCVFLAVPVAGPCLYYPESISQSILGTATYTGMTSSLAEFRTFRASGRMLTGFGYFIALPSLHAALATALQWFAARRAPWAWALLPVNAGATLATFLLGWHYAIDTALGIALGASACAIVARRSRRVNPLNP
jgi:hypothetical protein